MNFIIISLRLPYFLKSETFLNFHNKVIIYNFFRVEEYPSETCSQITDKSRVFGFGTTVENDR